MSGYFQFSLENYCQTILDYIQPTSAYFRTSFPYQAGLLLTVVLAPLTLLFTFLFSVASLKARKEHSSVPAGLPWMGKRDEFLASIRANVRGFVKSAALYTEGYRKYSKAGRVYVVPTWTRGPQIVVPPSMGLWIAAMPDDVLNAKDCTYDNVQFKYTVGHPEILANDMIDLLIKRELTRTTGTMNVEITEEIEDSLESLFGADGQWRKVGVFDTLTRTVGRVSSRVFVGEELCRNMEYVMSASDFARAVSVSGYILHLFPKAISWFATMPNRRHSGIAMKHLQPLVARRITDMRAKAADPTYPWEEPEDFITWMVRESFKRDTDHETSVHHLSYRIVLLNFGGITTTSIMVVNAVLDIWSTPNTADVIAALREEAECVLKEHGEWSKAALVKLHRLDSAIRESARVSAIGGNALARRVKIDGFMLPNGLAVPKNYTIGVSMDGIHFDEEHYDRPTVYDPFRFSRPREEALASEKRHVNEDLVTTSVHWLPFSHGLHACPGRFFAANNVKIILAQLLLDYEIQPFATRPPNVAIGDMSVVPVDATMMIRKRDLKAEYTSNTEGMKGRLSPRSSPSDTAVFPEGEFETTFTIKNTSSVKGRESSQVYVSDKESSLPRPVKELKGFVKTALKGGESKIVKVKLDCDALVFTTFVAKPG
ncbi:cytochrome P450 [Mycena capillaripes]|nr:cytochrome P450 [Mycena capillaripes]